MKISRHNQKTANFPSEPKTDTPVRQTTGTFFFPVVMKISLHNKKTANFPPEPKTDTPARQTTGTFFFPVVMKIFRHNKKTANFPPEPKTDTPARWKFPATTKKLPISRQNHGYVEVELTDLY